MPLVDFVGILAGDDLLTVFADGRLIGGNSGIWDDARWFSFSSSTKIVAVSVFNTRGGFGGFLGVFSNGVVTDGSWKCKETYGLEIGWEQTNFTDDAWPHAFMRRNNSGPSDIPQVSGIPSNVHWVSPANQFFPGGSICRRRFRMEEKASDNSTYHPVI